MMMVLLLTATVMTAKDIRTLVVTTTPQMHCKNCENRVKLCFKDVKGIKTVDTSVADQTVTIVYNAKKTSEEELIQLMDSKGYKARRLADGERVVKEAHECKEKKADGDCGE